MSWEFIIRACIAFPSLALGSVHIDLFTGCGRNYLGRQRQVGVAYTQSLSDTIRLKLQDSWVLAGKLCTRAEFPLICRDIDKKLVHYLIPGMRARIDPEV
jgi:hypothetical protein